MRLNHILTIFLLCLLFSTGILSAQPLPEDYSWGSIDRQKVINSKDDGFISVCSGNGKYLQQTIVKINSRGELVFRYEANPEKMFKKFIRDGEIWQHVFFYEMSDQHIAVWFSAAKENHCPSALFYYILSPAGTLVQATRVPLDRDFKTLEIAQLDNMVMLNDEEVILSLSYGPTCKDIFNNSHRNTTVLYNLRSGNIRYLPRLYGHEVLAGFAENGFVYLLTVPVRFYRASDGTKEYRQNRFYQLWKLDSTYEVATNPLYFEISADNPLPRLVSEGKQIRLIYCRRLYNEVEYGYKLIDKSLMISTGSKLYKSEIFPEHAFVSSDDYYLYGTTLISDSSADNMIFFPLEYWSASRKDKKNVYAQVVKESVQRNETNIRILEEKNMFSVSQINRAGKYLIASNYGFYYFIGDMKERPLPVFHYNEKQVAIVQQRLHTETIIPPGTPVSISDISRDDRYYPAKESMLGKAVIAGDILVRAGNGMYTGYLVDKTGNKIFMYGVRLAYIQ